ncbi:aminomethyl-transferring glycine dehydrogenase subunit GcvPA [Athalassotoga saccharophila]|uniref:aminomethyl-transferring glycine dehydrogenase subunit GcvPA n=1 Tax=Athalassotoga saccharophila TaxID=1441386 RepID=UPI00137B0548|nr:aminomethyl-transferring glycine dehydrogenase subunit GcvPA [Athalassotoga saccharophila]BBJ28251.1 putative glycine dehydrogenase (decarboxylating) subunit 1 [Athalassotoga saccharophila]
MDSYIPHTNQDVKEMLEAIGVKDVDSLFSTIPAEKRIDSLDLPDGMDEFNVLSKLRKMAYSNASADRYSYFLGAGIYNHVIPSAVSQIVSRGDFYTAYTPYQAEVSQGTLQSLFEFQTMICEITGMGIANASMYDGASALAEAVLMASRYTQKYKALIADTVHPEYLETVKTYVAGPGIKIENFSHDETGMVSVKDLKSKIDDETACVVVQYPNFYGIIEDLKSIKESIGDILFIVVANPISLGILEAPGKLGSDIVVGDGQSLGIPMNLGGPAFGFFAIREDQKLVRTMPGRIIGETVDVEGKRGFVMTLQAREQHIRREKATSNICSNHALGTLYASVYLSLLGPAGLKEIGELNLSKSHYLLDRLEETGHFERVFYGEFFNEFVVRTDLDVRKFYKTLFKNKIIGPLDLSKLDKGMQKHLLFCATEANTKEEIDKLISVVEAI